MKNIKVTLKRSTIGANRQQIAAVQGLGLRKIRSSSVLCNTPAIRGMVKKVIHLLDIEEVEA